MTPLESLKLKLVARDCARFGIVKPEHVRRIAARTEITDRGAVIGLKANGNPGVGTAEDFNLSVADVALDLGITVPHPEHALNGHSAHVKNNPFRPGHDFDLAGQFRILRDDEPLACDLARDAGTNVRDI